MANETINYFYYDDYKLYSSYYDDYLPMKGGITNKPLSYNQIKYIEDFKRLESEINNNEGFTLYEIQLMLTEFPKGKHFYLLNPTGDKIIGYIGLEIEIYKYKKFDPIAEILSVVVSLNEPTVPKSPNNTQPKGTGWCTKMLITLIGFIEKHHTNVKTFKLYNTGGVASCKCYVTAFESKGYKIINDDNLNIEITDKSSCDEMKKKNIDMDMHMTFIKQQNAGSKTKKMKRHKSKRRKSKKYN